MKSKVYSFCLTRSIAVGFINGYSHVSGVVSKFHHHFRHLMALVAIFSTPYNPKKSCFGCSFTFSPPFQASNGAGGNIFNSIQPQKIMFRMQFQIFTTISGISWRRWQYFQLHTTPKSHVSDVVSNFHHHFRHLMALVAIFSTPYNPKKSCFRWSFKFSPLFQASNGAEVAIFSTYSQITGLPNIRKQFVE